MRRYLLLGVAGLVFAAPAFAGWFDWGSDSGKKKGYDYSHKDAVTCKTNMRYHYLCQYRDRRAHKREYCDEHGNRCKP
jgi:hypothetical protein